MHLDYSIITPKIIVGRLPCCRECFDSLYDIGVTHIMNACQEPGYTIKADVFNRLYPDIIYFQNPELDDGIVPKPVEWFWKAINFADTVSSGKLFIHCFEGRNRAPSLAYVILRSHLYNMSPEEARTLLTTKRPIIEHGLAYANCAETAITKLYHA